MNRGFTFIEIMIVVGVITLLAAIAIPNMLRARIAAQETAAASGVKTVVASQTQYRVTHSRYASLADLDDDIPPYMDSVLAGGKYQSYNFVSAPVAGSESRQFIITAVPETLSQGHSYYSDEDGVLCRSDATNTAAPAAHTDSGCPAGFTEME